MWTEQLMVSSA